MERHHRVTRATLDDDEQSEAHHSQCERSNHQWMAGTKRRPLEQPEDEPSQPNDAEDSAEPVDTRRAGRIVALIHETER